MLVKRLLAIALICLGLAGCTGGGSQTERVDTGSGPITTPTANETPAPPAQEEEKP